VATAERYEATLLVAHRVHPYLQLALVLVNETGHRIGAVRQLRRSDLHLDTRPDTITWPESSDKQGIRWERTPITEAARQAIDRHLRKCPVIGDGYLFPSPRTPGKPHGATAFNRWLKQAEQLAGLEPLDGGLWHPYRRKFATEMVDVPDRIVARLGGWKTPRTLDLYSQPGREMLVEALSLRKQLREAQ
jgi:integrase